MAFKIKHMVVQLVPEAVEACKEATVFCLDTCRGDSVDCMGSEPCPGHSPGLEPRAAPPGQLIGLKEYLQREIPKGPHAPPTPEQAKVLEGKFNEALQEVQSIKEGLKGP
jgi:hypothetical protein